jgi:phosphoglycerate dehydrogenase-like enzyme
VVEKDLIRALKEEPDRTALLDVTWPEPPEPEASCLRCQRVPHAAHRGRHGREVARMGRTMREESEKFLAGEKPAYEVTEKMLETMA